MKDEQLTTLLVFQKKSDGNDGFGNSTPGTGPYVEFARRYGSCKAAKAGTEAMQGGQLSSLQSYTLRIRNDPAAVLIDSSYRVLVATMPGTPPLAIVSVADPDMRGQWLDIAATRGAVT